MKQSKKIFTRMVDNNWGGISHKVMEFHEYVNLFSGKAVQVNLPLWCCAGCIIWKYCCDIFE